MKQADIEGTSSSLRYGTKLRNFRRYPPQGTLAKNKLCQRLIKKPQTCDKRAKGLRKRKIRKVPGKEKRIEEQRNLVTMKILVDLKQKIDRVCSENTSSKYLSKKVFQKIAEDGLVLGLNQDQKKSLQCNLIYNILKYLQWDQLISYFKKYRHKVKILKVSKFKQYILQGKLFEKEANPKMYQISAGMVKDAVAKLSDSNALLQNLLQKKTYTKLFQQCVQKYKQKMTVLMYKIRQFIELLQKEKNNLNSKEQPQLSLKGQNTEYECFGSAQVREKSNENQCESIIEMACSQQSEMGAPIPLMGYFISEINQTEMQKCSIFEDIHHEIQSQENSYPLHMI